MRFRLVATIALFLSLLAASFLVQSSIAKPQSTLGKASNYLSVSAKICVYGNRAGKYEVEVKGGDLHQGSKGLVTSSKTLSLGDCSTVGMNLKPAITTSRYAFAGRVTRVESLQPSSRFWLFVNQMRERLSKLVGDAPNLVAGLAVGYDDGLSKTFLTAMKTTGLTHLTAVSGANCAIVIGLVWLLIRKLPIPKPIRTGLVMASLFGYVIVVGMQPSVLRAAFMIGAVYLALEFGRRVWLPRALAFGCCVLLVVDPWLLVDYGFWLSALATYGLISVTPKFAEYFERYFPKSVSGLLAATVAAQLWCLPVLVLLQGGFTTYSILANMLVEPVVPVVTILGVLAALASVLFPNLFMPLMDVASWFASWIVTVATNFSAAPEPLLWLPGGFWGFFITAALVLTFTFGVAKRRSLIATALVLISIAVWLANSSKEVITQSNWPPSNWSIVACDVGQGDSMVIHSEGQTALIDTGKDPEAVDKCLDRLAIKSIQLLVLTHFDADHVAGLPGVLRGRTVETALVSKFSDSRALAIQDRELLDRYASQVIAASENLSGALGAFRWQVFSSQGDLAENSNQASLGISFLSNRMSIYTLADLDERVQCSINTVHQLGLPSVIKVSHHGSSDQCSSLYSGLSPDISIISVGAANPYGHPTAKTIGMLKSIGSTIFRTDKLGSIAIVQNEKNLTLSVIGSR